MHSFSHDPTRTWQSLLPKDCRIGGMHVLSEAMVSQTQIPRETVFDDVAQRMGRQALRLALARCVKQVPASEHLDYETLHPGQVIFSLDAYVLTPDELLAVIAAARAEGAYDESRWRRPLSTEK
jgi:hypothetical protein